MKKSKVIKMPKLGLALGSGGAKGMAHIGAIKAFEDYGIEFDMVAGTSIGSIVGALYANGYTSDDMLAILKSVNLAEIKNLIMLKMDTQPVEIVLDKIMGDLTFEELKKPFFCYATNTYTGEGRGFSRGKIIKPITASCAMPPFFKSVYIDGENYCDGAFYNSIPANSLKKVGCDYVIGIDLAEYKEQTKASELFKSFTVRVPVLQDGRKMGYEYSDYMLKPYLKDMTATDIGKLEEMYDAGYNEVACHIDEIKEEIEKL